MEQEANKALALAAAEYVHNTLLSRGRWSNADNALVAAVNDWYAALNPDSPVTKARQARLEAA